VLPSRFDQTLEAYRGLETLLSGGKVGAIGVSNFMPDHLERLLAEASVVPAVNQVEVHPYFSPADRPGRRCRARHPYPGMVADRRHHVLPRDRRERADRPGDRGDREVAREVPAQVMLRWQSQQGRSAIPKTVNPARIAENFDVFDFELTAGELTAIDASTQGSGAVLSPTPSRSKRTTSRSRRPDENSP
jgi:2,5-diketo-D-gluconate reductase A